MVNVVLKIKDTRYSVCDFYNKKIIRKTKELLDL